MILSNKGSSLYVILLNFDILTCECIKIYWDSARFSGTYYFQKSKVQDKILQKTVCDYFVLPLTLKTLERERERDFCINSVTAYSASKS